VPEEPADATVVPTVMPVVFDNVAFDDIPLAGPFVPHKKLSPLEGALVF
jgi:hypothetical protein